MVRTPRWKTAESTSSDPLNPTQTFPPPPPPPPPDSHVSVNFGGPRRPFFERLKTAWKSFTREGLTTADAGKLIIAASSENEQRVLLKPLPPRITRSQPVMVNVILYEDDPEKHAPPWLDIDWGRLPWLQVASAQYVVIEGVRFNKEVSAEKSQRPSKPTIVIDGVKYVRQHDGKFYEQSRQSKRPTKRKKPSTIKRGKR